MPHLVILYTPQLDDACDMGALCRRLADTMLAVRDSNLRRVFPRGGTRVLAFRAAHHAVADGSGDPAFAYFNLRMGRGRSDAVKQRVGEALLAVARAHFAAVLGARPVGLTLQIDEGTEVYDARFGNLHTRFENTRS